MVPHMSGTTLDAQYRYATGAQEILRRWFAGEKQEPTNLIVENGEVSMSRERAAESPIDVCSTRPRHTASEPRSKSTLGRCQKEDHGILPAMMYEYLPVKLLVSPR
jgi:hypothetical protein